MFSFEFGEAVIKVVKKANEFFPMVHEKIADGDTICSIKWSPLYNFYRQMKWENINVENSFAYLDCLYVNEEFRNKGYGALILSEICCFLAGKGFSILALQVFPFESQSEDMVEETTKLIHFYEKSGFKRTEFSNKNENKDNYMFKTITLKVAS